MHAHLKEPRARRPGDRFLELLWFRALSPDGKLPMPTIDRIKAVSGLVASWNSDDDSQADD